MNTPLNPSLNTPDSVSSLEESWESLLQKCFPYSNQYYNPG